MQRIRLMFNHAAAAAIQQQHLRPLTVYWSLAQHQKPVGGSLGDSRTRDTRSLKASVQKITLIQQNQSISITTLEEAQKLAKRRDLHLLRLEQTDAKTGRAMFKWVYMVIIGAWSLLWSCYTLQTSHSCWNAVGWCGAVEISERKS